MKTAIMQVRRMLNTQHNSGHMNTSVCNIKRDVFVSVDANNQCATTFRTCMYDADDTLVETSYELCESLSYCSPQHAHTSGVCNAHHTTQCHVLQ